MPIAPLIGKGVGPGGSPAYIVRKGLSGVLPSPSTIWAFDWPLLWGPLTGTGPITSVSLMARTRQDATLRALTDENVILTARTHQNVQLGPLT